MPEIVMKKLGTYIGAEVLDVDRDRLLADDDLPQACTEHLTRLIGAGRPL